MKIYEIYLSYNNEPNRKDEIFSEFIKKIEPLINKNARLVEENLREDFCQELHIKVFNILDQQKFILNGILDARTETELINKFITKSMDNYIYYQNSKHSKEGFELFMSKFTIYVGNVKLLKFLIISFRNFKIDFLIKRNRNKEFFFDDEYEVIDNDDNYILHSFEEILNNIYISNKDRDFINLFIKDDTLLTQKEVVIILNVSHQYVSQRFNQIKTKIRRKDN